EWNRDHANLFCSLRTSGDCTRLSSEQQIHLYRIVQEALTNAAAHSQATQVDVSLEVGSRVILLIRDDGHGFEPASAARGMGLSGMQERAQALGGHWQLDTAPGAGVTIRADFPLTAPGTNTP